jgi:excinuclease ABC subunit C
MLDDIKNKLSHLTTQSGVYQMLDNTGTIIYIGKAKNLKNRVRSYFNAGRNNAKTIAMVNNIVDVQVIVVETEIKALLLENELIKKHQPKYNILLKDAKTYPYIFISNDTHPRIGFYRGVKNKKYHYFGPYPSVGVIRESLTLLKKIFKLRECANSVYKSRSRPCLEYQMGLCSAPCVGKISDEDYYQDSKNAQDFLSGKSQAILKTIENTMNYYADKQEFELAAHYRDQMMSLRKIQEKHQANSDVDIDCIAVVKKNGVSCVQLIFVRNGKQIGDETLYPKNTHYLNEAEILERFLPLYYSSQQVSATIVTSHKIANYSLIEQALQCNIAKRIDSNKKHFLDIATLTATENLKHMLMKQSRVVKQLQHLQTVLGMSLLPKHIECFDISHHSGEATIASCVVFKDGVPDKKSYRGFNISGITVGDDFAAMRKAIFKRYKENENIPDLLLIDGGLGQLNQAIMVFDSLGIHTTIVGVAKGEGRKAGLETLILKDNEDVKKINLKPDNIALNLVNRVRDEAHRFAISKHRKKFKKTRNTSLLENIEGVGAAKRKALLSYFGSANEVQNAGLNELIKVDGINEKIASKIIAYFQN